jgi:hypothetical protein
MTGKIWLLILTCAVLFSAFSGCASQAKVDYLSARDKGTLQAYSQFLEKHPDSEFTPLVERRISRIKDRQRDKERLRREAAEKRIMENKQRRSKIESYKTGELTLEKFDSDGWNAGDPHRGIIGIVGFTRKEGVTTYYLGTKNIVDMSQMPPNIPHPGDTAEAMFKPIRHGQADAFMKPSAGAKNYYTLRFVDGICRDIVKYPANHTKP